MKKKQPKIKLKMYGAANNICGANTGHVYKIPQAKVPIQVNPEIIHTPIVSDSLQKYPLVTNASATPAKEPETTWKGKREKAKKFELESEVPTTEAESSSTS